MDALPWHRKQLREWAARKERMPHALLIFGRQGIGKLAFAHALAQLLLCEGAWQAVGASCGICGSCKWYEEGNHPDFHLIEPDTAPEGSAEEEGTTKKGGRQITIEKIRVIPDFMNITSHRGGPKVVLIHPAEALNLSAANALLKSLEEPASQTYFLLITHRPSQVAITVRSRCQQIALLPPPPAVAGAWLRQEGINDPELALAHTGNSPLLARDLADKEFWQQRDFFLRSLADSLLNPLVLAEQIRDYPLDQVVGWMQKWTFDLILEKFAGRVCYNPDYAIAIKAAAARVDSLSALRFHRAVVRMQAVVDHPLNPRLVLEKLLMDYADLVEKWQGGSEAHV